MVDEDVQYEFKSVTAVRGTEGRSIAKWQKAGWELVDRSPGTLRTTLNFRRVKPKLPLLPIAVLGGVAFLVALVVGIVSAIHGGDDEAPTSTAQASQDTSETVKPDASRSRGLVAKQTVTRKNNAEFAALLALSDNCDERIEPFAAKYEDRAVEFDASIAAMASHGGDKTRYDILVSPGDKGPESGRGPTFQFADVNVSDLHFVGDKGPDALSTGAIVHVIARVGEYNPNQCQFFLDPVSTKIR